MTSQVQGTVSVRCPKCGAVGTLSHVVYAEGLYAVDEHGAPEVYVEEYTVDEFTCKACGHADTV